MKLTTKFKQALSANSSRADICIQKVTETISNIDFAGTRPNEYIET